MHDVAGVHLPQADAPGDRCGDAAIDEVELGALDRRLIALDRGLDLLHRRHLGVELLLGDRILLAEDLVALEVDLGVFQGRLVASLLSLRLHQLHLEGARIELGEQIALVHQLPFAKVDAQQLPVDAALDRRGVERGDVAQAGQIDRDVADLCRRHDDRHRRRRRLGSLGVLAIRRLRLPAAAAGDEQVGAEGDRGDDEHPGPPAAAPDLGVTDGRSAGGLVDAGPLVLRGVG